MNLADYVLIADIEPATHRVLTSFFGQKGYRVVATGMGTEAFTTAMKQIPALVLVNDVLPGIDGYSLCRRLRDHPSTHTVPIILLASHDLVTGRVAALEAGADDYLPKPFRPAELQDHVSRLLNKPAPTVLSKSKQAPMQRRQKQV